MSDKYQKITPKENQQLIGESIENIKKLLLQIGEPDKKINMRAKQIWNWVYCHGVFDFDGMVNVSKELREKLQEYYQQFVSSKPEIISKKTSNDDTTKWLLRFNTFDTPVDVEVVHIPEKSRNTVCVSTQAGCVLNCTFCHTGTQRLKRNLTSAEIIWQIITVKNHLSDWSNRDTKLITNVVIMGMGEPLYNFDEVAKAVNIMTDTKGLSLSKRRVTLSTSGVANKIVKMGEKTGVMLAISLHAAYDELRNTIVPINRKFPLEVLLKECAKYPSLSNARRITFEYIMLRGVNDSLDDAKKLAKLLRSVHCKINLIPFNPWDGSIYKTSKQEDIDIFTEYLANKGYTCTTRKPRGQDIYAACGQLKTAIKKEMKL